MQTFVRVPSQVPPHAVPSDAHAGREPTGAPTTAVQLPGTTLHAWH